MVYNANNEAGNSISSEIIASTCEKLRTLGLNCDASFVAEWALINSADMRTIKALESFASMLRKKYDERLIGMLLQMSRLPIPNARSFDSFDGSRMTADNRDMISALRSLTFMEAGTNVVIYGDEGTGKTHIAQAIGLESCLQKKKAIFYRAAELKAAIRRHIDKGRENEFTKSISATPCLIVDEIDKCSFDKQESMVFFQIVDKRYEKRFGAMVFTSNKKPSEWGASFSESYIAKCIMDRIFDRCINIEMRGESFRGKDRKSFKLNFGNSPYITGLE